MTAPIDHVRDMADYIADNYGTCIRDSECLCRGYCDKHHDFNCHVCPRTGWRGRACPNWHPTSARTFEELAARALTFVNTGETT